MFNFTKKFFRKDFFQEEPEKPPVKKPAKKPPAKKIRVAGHPLAEWRKFFWIVLLASMVVVPLGVWSAQKLEIWLTPEKNPLRAVGIAPGAVFDRDFSLTSQTGATVTGEHYSSRAWVVFFGFTHCPDVCPLILSRLSGLWGQVKHPERIQLFFITVDPERDSPSALADYMKAFDPSFIALTGEDVKIKMIEKNFHIYASKVQEQGSDDYSMDHTATVTLLRSDGTFAGTIDMDETDASMLAKLNYLTGG